MKNLSKEEVRTAEEVLRDCSDGIAYESWKRKHNATLQWILAAMEEYAKSEVSEYSQAYQLRQSALVNELYARITELEESQFKSKSEAQTEKPDFEQLAVDYTSGCKVNNHEHDCGCGAFEQGCEIIWDKYVSPLQARVKELEFSYKSIEGVYIAAEKHNELL